MIKQIPNIFTLLNLFFGCIAIFFVLNSYTVLTAYDDNGQWLNIPREILNKPEKLYWASICIIIAAIIDFLDGFVARLLKASSEMGKQLDSLADVVSFGVAPSMIVLYFLRMCYMQDEDGLEVSLIYLSPAFIIACAGAYRLARFNIDTSQSTGFKGVPIPAAGLLIAAFPLIYHQTNATWVYEIMMNKWFWYGVILVVSYLMVSTLPMLALKFKGVSFQKLLPFIIVLVVGVITAILLKWIAVPVGFLVYVTVSLVTNRSK